MGQWHARRSVAITADDMLVCLKSDEMIVCLKRCGATDLQIPEIWPCDASAARPMVANPRTNHVSAGGFGILLSEWTCTPVPCWWPSPVAEVESRWRLRSAATAALIIPATARSTIGDHTFSVIAARAWNSLPLSVTSSSSPQCFRKHLKTVLFTRGTVISTLRHRD